MTTNKLKYNDYYSLISLNPILQTGGNLCLLELEQNIGYNPS